MADEHHIEVRAGAAFVVVHEAGEGSERYSQHSVLGSQSGAGTVPNVDYTNEVKETVVATTSLQSVVTGGEGNRYVGIKHLGVDQNDSPTANGLDIVCDSVKVARIAPGELQYLLRPEQANNNIEIEIQTTFGTVKAEIIHTN